MRMTCNLPDGIYIGKIVTNLGNFPIQEEMLLFGLRRFRDSDDFRITNIFPKQIMGTHIPFIMITDSRYDIPALYSL